MNFFDDDYSYEYKYPCCTPEGFWKSKDGTLTPISSIGDEHLNNIISLMNRKIGIPKTITN